MGLLERILGPRPDVGQPIVVRSEQAEPLLVRDVEPLEGTLMSLWNSTIPNWWAENMSPSSQWLPGDGRLAERVWITSRCLQMNSQQIASMPLRFESPNVLADSEPAWVSNPDPLYYPNGISSIVKALMRDYYGWGYALAYVTNRYADGYPRTFTRVPACACEPTWSEQGRRQYKVGEKYLDPADVIQIDRDCGDSWTAHGTSAIKSYAQLAWGLLAAGNQAMDVAQGGVPKAVLKITDPNRKVTKEQAEALQAQWMVRTQARNGAPPVLPPELDFESLSWNPKDMALLETQEFNTLALAAAFGIPAILLNMAVDHGMTYQNPGMLGELWWRFELRPTAKAFEDAFTAQMLPSGQWVWFDAQDTFLPLVPTTTETGPSATASDDPQAAVTQMDAPPAASASPAQNGNAPALTAIGGNR